MEHNPPLSVSEPVNTWFRDDYVTSLDEFFWPAEEVDELAAGDYILFKLSVEG